DFALARYLPNGALDSTFGSGGKVITDFGRFDGAASVILQDDNGVLKLIAGGWTGPYVGPDPSPNADFALARYLVSNGSLDTDPVTGFGPLMGGQRTGKVTTNFIYDSYDEAYGLALETYWDGAQVRTRLVAAGQTCNYSVSVLVCAGGSNISSTQQ